MTFSAADTLLAQAEYQWLKTTTGTETGGKIYTGDNKWCYLGLEKSIFVGRFPAETQYPLTNLTLTCLLLGEAEGDPFKDSWGTLGTSLETL